jgi:hypothetical protein
MCATTCRSVARRTGGDLLLLARPRQSVSLPSSRGLWGHPTGGRLRIDAGRSEDKAKGITAAWLESGVLTVENRPHGLKARRLAARRAAPPQAKVAP